MSSLLLTGIRQLVTNDSTDSDLLGVISEAAVAVVDGTVAWVGPEADLPSEHAGLARVDCEGRAVIPGFVDAHTHLVFAGDRSDEFARRLRGERYEDILAAGGGIHSTVEATRNASTEALLEATLARAERMLRHGTTTIEVKSGYGLATGHELRLLEVAAAVGQRSAIDVVPTFLGAHVPANGLDSAAYVDLVVNEMLAACAPYARYCDVFCDEGAFSVAESRRVLEAGRAHGLGLRVHAEQLSRTGAAQLAAELGATTADHLDQITFEDAAALARSQTVAVLLPAVSFSMRSPQPPGRLLWDAGVTVALGTDCNPGTSYAESMFFVVALATVETGLTPEEAIWASTRGGALSIEAGDKGVVEPGAVADLVILDAPSYAHIPYRPATNLAWKVIKDGRVV
jgi:imidazolonepropionase